MLAAATGRHLANQQSSLSCRGRIGHGVIKLHVKQRRPEIMGTRENGTVIYCRPLFERCSSHLSAGYVAILHPAAPECIIWHLSAFFGQSFAPDGQRTLSPSLVLQTWITPAG
jgi:hypothetical protein